MSSNIIKLGGHEFALVKNGVDEHQISDFILKLSQEREVLLKERESFKERECQLGSLNKLAERTVVEAEKMAADIQREAADHVKKEAKTILDKARNEADTLLQERRAQTESAVDKIIEELKLKVLEMEQTLKRSLNKAFSSQTEGIIMPQSETSVLTEIEAKPSLPDYREA